MAVRITHTNNSDGHDGTFVYRSTGPMDPQDLPAPIADAPPVALGEVFEYIDVFHFTGDQCYRTQDHEDGQLGTLSDEKCITVPEILALASIGDYIAGGVYAGTITYADSREFHIIFAIQDGEGAVLQWGNFGTTTGATDPDDGLANQNLILGSFDNGDSDAFYHCRDYVNEGFSDWYLPAENELALESGLRNHPEFSTSTTALRWSSTEVTATRAHSRRFSDGSIGNAEKNGTSLRTRPVRRVEVES